MQSRPIIRKGKPEEIVNDRLRGFFKQHGWVMQRVESKAVYSKRLGRYLAGMTLRSTTDWMGCNPSGRACFVESKVKVTPSAMKPGQREYIIERIHSNAFACVVDGPEMLARYYAGFTALESREARVAFLLSKVPDEPVRRARTPK